MTTEQNPAAPAVREPYDAMGPIDAANPSAARATLATVQPGGRVRLGHHHGGEQAAVLTGGDDARARFEAWAHAQSYRGGNIMADRDAAHPAVYADPVAQLTWKAWQAALAARQPVGISADWVLGYLTTDAPEDSREAIRNAFAEHAALSGVRQPVCPKCKGSGEGVAMIGSGPDVHDVDADCTACDGTGARQPEVMCNGMTEDEANQTMSVMGLSSGRQPVVESDTLVNGGALRMALNVLRRAGKSEVADELESTAARQPGAQVPAAWMSRDALEAFAKHRAGNADAAANSFAYAMTGDGFVPLYDAPPAQAVGQEPVAIPEGWALVDLAEYTILPQIPTTAMMDAGWPIGEQITDQFDVKGAYADLIAEHEAKGEGIIHGPSQPPAQAVDLGQFRAAITREYANSRALCDMPRILECEGLLALIDGKAVGK